MFPKREMLLLGFAVIFIAVLGGVKGASERAVDGASQRSEREPSEGVTDRASAQVMHLRDSRIKRGTTASISRIVR